MEQQLDVLARAVASGEVSRRKALRQLGGAMAGALLAYLGIGCETTPTAPSGPRVDGPRLDGGRDDCKATGKACKKPSQCCSGNCCGGVCCATGQICLNGTCANPCTPGACGAPVFCSFSCPEGVGNRGACLASVEGPGFCGTDILCAGATTCPTGAGRPRGTDRVRAGPSAGRPPRGGRSSRSASPAAGS
jgi:hypothetical protein